MKKIINILLKYTVLLGFSVILSNCSLLKKDKDSDDKPTVQKKRYEPNTYKRLENYSGKSGILGQKEIDKLAKSNILWKASLQTLSDLPILSASYDGGVISTDWYGNQEEQIRITVLFNSSEVKASSFNVKGFKKTCNKNLTCTTSSTSDSFNNKIKSKIIEKIAQLKLSQNK